MRTLAVDTSTKAQALALTDGATVVARRLTRVKTNHSESLLANIDDMLRQAAWKPGDLELVCVGLGPGTFTGLRVGLSTAKALARATGAALVGVDSLAATANPITALFDGYVVSLVDARRGEVYLGVHHRTASGLACDHAAEAATPARVRAVVEELEGPVVIAGGGLRAYPELLTWQRSDIVCLPEPWDGPSSVSIAFLGARMFADRGPDDLAELEPNYVRLSDAEMNFGPPDTQQTVLK